MPTGTVSHGALGAADIGPGGYDEPVEETVRRYHRMIWKMVNLYHGTLGRDYFDDLFVAGQMGVVKAVETYDPTRGASFRTWACFKIRTAVMEERRSLLGTKRRHRPSIVSFEAESWEGATQRWLADRAPGPEDLAVRSFDIDSFSRGLSARDAEMVRRRLGGVTATQLAGEYGLTVSRVSQIMGGAKKKQLRKMGPTTTREPTERERRKAEERQRILAAAVLERDTEDAPDLSYEERLEQIRSQIAAVEAKQSEMARGA